ncbi:YndM family protein [Caldibacillus debilis]|uniref:YndM family protein n=1 Tax=Caldibacillus debilis TaxID=301148 RepID=UPI0003804CFE|nr:YndM family protein [Caldibacillus debilis]
MKHFAALFVKFLFYSVILLFVLGFMYEISAGDVVLISLILSAGLYITGDLYVLPRFGNRAAALTDFPLAFLGIWTLGNYAGDFPRGMGSAGLISAVILSIFEFYYHYYLLRNVIQERDRKGGKPKFRLLKKPVYHAEIAEEPLQRNREEHNRRPT